MRERALSGSRSSSLGKVAIVNAEEAALEVGWRGLWLEGWVWFGVCVIES